MNKRDTTSAAVGSASLSTVNITVGTAGHIDHGKTQLVKLLTGCDTDRLPEEKARGMTIDLGFATAALPNDRRVGIVDVPGHERFIHNMVAGVTGIDVVLLVVAADDGVMPQTVEHFHIVRILGVRKGMVAITKVDLVGPERVKEVESEVRNLAAGSFLAGCPVVGVSSKTGQGFDAFYDTFVATVDETPERDPGGPFRLYVERSFVLQGRGVIVSGVPRSGTVRLGDSLDLLPGRAAKRVRGIQVYGVDAGEGHAGECVALNMAGLAPDEVTRGCVLTAPGFFHERALLNAKLAILPGEEEAIKPRMAVRFHIGTSDVPGYLVLHSQSPPRVDGEAYVQLQLKRPVVAAPGDPFIVRRLSPERTLGGGRILAPAQRRIRRSKAEWVAACREQESAFQAPDSAIAYVLAHADAPMKLSDLSRAALVTEAAARTALEALLDAGGGVHLGADSYVHVRHFQETRAQLLAALGRLHEEQPLSTGFAKKDIVHGLGADKLLLQRAFDVLQETGEVGSGRAGFFLPSRVPRLSPEKAALAAKIAERYRETAFAAPRLAEVPEQVGAPAALVEPLVRHLVQTGELVEIDPKVILHKDRVGECREKLVAYLEAHGTIDAGAFRDLIGTTRKYAIPLLEYWDRQGLTRREGDLRSLKGGARMGR
ncbi:MAG: selenocysteine-specific translation elongation factor [Kiritimatiellae bacterium]|nr:selenocysteine-specific translation elongation factor [Kiritimatiellia bacterium]